SGHWQQDHFKTFQIISKCSPPASSMQGADERHDADARATRKLDRLNRRSVALFMGRQNAGRKSALGDAGLVPISLARSRAWRSFTPFRYTQTNFSGVMP